MTVKLIDFHADWCGPCENQEPIVNSLDADYPELDLEKVDVEHDRERANEYHVRSLPTIVIEEGGEIVDRFVGVTQRDELEAALDKTGVEPDATA